MVADMDERNGVSKREKVEMYLAIKTQRMLI